MSRLAPLVAVALAGCSFHIPVAGSGDDAGPIDAPGTTADASIDGPPSDLDGDGIANSADNCPMVHNVDQRDHDADNRGDRCDVCPHLMSTIHADADGDGIGDDCDPRPSMAGDVVRLWDGFYADSAALSWTKTGTWTLDNGTLRQTATGNTYIALPMDLPRTFIQAAATIEQTNGSFQTIGVFAGDPLDNIQSYGCLASHSPPSSETVSASANWFGVPGANSPVAWTGTLAANQAFRFQLMLTTGVVGCVVRHGAVTGADSEVAGPLVGKPGIYLDDVATRFDYMFVVEPGL